MMQRARRSLRAITAEPAAQQAAFPLALLPALHAGDDEVGARAAAIVAERGDRAVGGNEERQDVEALGTGGANDSSVGSGGLTHQLGDLRAVPGKAIDEDLPGLRGGGLVEQQTGLGARREDLPASVDEVEDAVAWDPLEGECAWVRRSPAIDFTAQDADADAERPWPGSV